MHADFIEREAVLDHCPDERCRRSRFCRALVTRAPCARTHESRDAFREALAEHLERLAWKYGRPAQPLSDYEMDLAMAELKAALEQRERDEPAGL